jgi:flagellar hook-basal body complex protein FliE
VSAAPVQAVAAVGLPELLAAQGPGHAAAPQGASFAQVLMNGVESVNRQVVNADAMVRAFALDDSIPVHQVTFALEQARLSLELMMQVRQRLVEGYQRVMEMQL